MLRRFLALVALALAPVLSFSQDTLRINEFVASNSSYAPVGSPPHYSDWIEVHNYGGAAINLNGWHLTDSLTQLTKFKFPSMSIPAGGYVLVFASGTNKTSPRLEAAFSLNIEGESIALVKPDGVTIAHAITNVPPQFNNISYGVAANGELKYLGAPTPGAANSATTLAGALVKPRFSVERGFYQAPFMLTLSTPSEGATIRYTTNGVAPTPTTGFIYSGPIQISGTTPVTARAFRDGFIPSESETHTYFFLEDVVRQAANGVAPPGWPTSWGANVVDYGMDPDIVNDPVYGPQVLPALRAIPTFSVVMNLNDLFNPTTGIYANPGQDGRDWERPCSIELIFPDGRDGFQINGGIRIRGGFSRSTGNPKHALRLFFREEYGEPSLKYQVFGPDAADEYENFDLRTFQNYSWSFQGDANGVFIRDMFSRDTQLDMGHDAERGDYYHLYINGMYWGLYNSAERPEASYGETYYGGDKDDYDVIKVEAGPYTINATDGNMAAWATLYNTARAGITNDTVYFRLQGLNPDGTVNTNYPVYLDMPNLIDYMLVILYGGNLDAPISNFLGNSSPNNWYGMRSRVGRMGFKFFAHDSEHTLLNVNEDRTGPYSSGDTGVSKSNPQWIWQKLMANAEFKMLVADHVHRHFFNNGALTPEAAKARFAERTNQIYLPVIAESARWGDAKRATPLKQSDWLAAVGRVNTYMNTRSTVVLNQLRADGLYPATAAPTFSQFGGHVNRGHQLSITASNPVYYTLDGSDPRLIGGAISPSAKLYTGAVTLNESARVRARARSSTGVWSAINDAAFIIIQNFSELVITEIMYNPPDVPGEPGVDGEEFEFVELKNTSNRELDLSGVHFSTGIDYTFANGTRLGPGQFIVLVSNPQAFTAKYPRARVSGAFTNNLANGGETLTLNHATGTVIARLAYSDDAPWPTSADGTGFSLTLINPNVAATPTSASAWRASSAVGGSPGADDPVSNVPAILITEVLTHTDLPDVDTIELHNPTAAAVDISVWYLTDSQNTPAKFRIPAGTLLGPGQHITFNESDFNPAPGSATSFSLSSLGEEVYLFSANAAGELTGYSHGFQFDAAANGVSFGRHVTSNNEIYYPAQRQRTLGSANAGPKIGPVIINEIRYGTFGGAEEFIELLNVSGLPVKLYDPQFPTNRWRIEGVDFTFPTNIEIPANGIVVVTGSDAAAFRSRYGIPQNVQVFGPYNGSLQDNGETVRLTRPDAPDATTGLVPYVTVDEVRYDDSSPWPANSLDPNFSLERVTASSFGNDPASWRASVNAPSPGFDNNSNRPPRVQAGPDIEGSHTSFPASINLSATVLDDGLPTGAVPTVQWTFVSGPGPVQFGNANSASTTALVPGVGSYVLRVTASDGSLSASDEVVITLERPAGPQVILPAGSIWRYSDTGVDMGNAWRVGSFNDLGWSQAPAQFGYGGNGEVTTLNFGPNSSAKYPTYYFRKKINVANPAGIQDLVARLIRDDGAIVYINNVEVLRVNMPEGAVTYSAYANSAIGGDDEFTFTDHVIDPGALVAGENTIAVEIHQSNAGSSDLSFNLELVASVLPGNSAPTVNAGADMVITLPASASLNAIVRDDALPQPPGFLASQWTKVSGPGVVTFQNANLPGTSASFSQPGLYTLRLTVNDGAITAADDVVVDVKPGTASPYDQWRATHFSAAELTNPAISGDNADPDLDTHTNMQEFLAGTNPRDGSSVLTLGAVTAPNGITLRATTIAGRSYTIQATPSLSTPVWERVADIDNSSGGIVERTDTSAMARMRFYRIVTPRVP
ncbi:MAG TPA: lamin tail domain-containing protein [Methylomirabilota bacterium]|nr:lamin tail domain-containing protein [Methylomirabilota bacterium]